ncbi:sulfite exporter TauE/SafE family protein [Sphaerochaeta sp. PS]|uniref:sulfite exporter TauE/SafE family protein n=1 Tax=Sphaerochaeta sp. PS TaxID=3076336 RepID=UPI0028A4CB94|nr:sulfite exporter TauE/SafE family protein [Sphaerochaeta sp. PS]MDT4763404.1 sulfite exporter TauE/SafE family protein [Sphaerochaeta sp. PS]
MGSVIIVLSCVFVGAFLQANIGFGFPIVAMILFPRFFPFSTAVTLTQLIAMASTGYLTAKYWNKIQWKALFPLLFASLAVAAFVTLFSLKVEQGKLVIVLGISLVLIALYFSIFSQSIHIQAKACNGLLMGTLAGFGNGLFGIGGPPVALYLLPALPGKLEYLATIQAYFFFCNLESIVIRTLNGALVVEQLYLIPLGWVVIGLGTFFGLKLFDKIPSHILKRIVYLFVGLSGLWIVVEALLQ